MSIAICKLHKSSHLRSSALFHIETRRWSLVEKDFSDGYTLAVPCHSPSCTHCECSYGPLLQICKLNPPAKVVKALLKADPLAAYEADCEGKYPLHIACEYGASPVVIKELIQANSRAVKEKDMFGMLPIHIISKNYLIKISHHLPKKIAQNCMIEAMRLVLSKDPEIILEEDENEKCAIEYAIESGLSLEVIHTLQLEAGDKQMIRSSFLK